MLHQLHAVRMIYQRIARDTRFGLIGLGETAVNHQQFAVRLYGALAFNNLHGHVSVDDM